MKPLVLVPLVLAALVAVPASARTLTIALDVSESNGLVESDAAAKAAASYARTQVAALQLGDWVHVRRFGIRSAGNLPAEKVRLTRAARPAAVAESVARYIAALPAKTSEGDNQTNILAFLEFGSFDCANGERIVLFTDGIEASRTISDKAFLSGKPLPPPQAGFLKGCEVVMFGLGQSKDGSLPPQLVKTIRAAWSDWMDKAGASFTTIIDP